LFIIKKLLKTIILIVIAIIIFFGIYRREYIVQAVPVYLQYLEQKIKWHRNSTDNYVYFFHDKCFLDHVLFINQDKLSYTFRNGNPHSLEFIADKERMTQYIQNRFCYSDQKRDYFLIDKLFDKIPTILWNKLWDFNDYSRYRYEIGYDEQYGYPIGILVDRENNKHIVSIGTHFPSFHFFIYDLKILPKDTVYSDKVLTKLLAWIEERNLLRNQEPIQESNSSKDASIVEEVGGNLIKGMIIKRY